MLPQLLLLFLGTILAFWISAICGGGASLILVPILNLLLPGSVVPFSLTIGTLTSSASRIAVFKKHISWTIVSWFVPFSIPAVFLGAWLIKFVNPIYLQFFVAVFLAANVTELVRSRKQMAKEEKPASKRVLAVVGFFAGFVSGITGAIGLLFNRFYLRCGLTKEEVVATRAANEIILHIIKLVIYILLGLYSQTALWLGLAIAAGSVISSWSVRYILPYLSEVVFRKTGYGAMAVSGIFLLADTSQQIIQQDNISVHTINSETTVKWRNSSFVLEYAIDEGLEVERPIRHTELPASLQQEYENLLPQYNYILLEKVFQFNKKPGFEFYCYKNKRLTKLEFEE